MAVLETVLGLFSLTQDHAQADWRTLAGTDIRGSPVRNQLTYSMDCAAAALRAGIRISWRRGQNKVKSRSGSDKSSQSFHNAD